MDESIIETWWINSGKVSCEDLGEMTCLQVQSNETLDPQAWISHPEDILGFEYEAGHIYQIRIKISDRQGPIPADANSKIYELVEVVSMVYDPSTRLTNSYIVTSVGEITDPKDPFLEIPLSFYFDATIKFFGGNLGCNSGGGEIIVNDGKNLELRLGRITLKACPDMELEKAVSLALSNTRSYEFENEELLFFNEAGEVLITFKPVD